MIATPRRDALPLPANLALQAARAGAGDPARGTWFARLAANVAMVARRWELDIGPPFEPGGQTAWVAPARTRDGTDLVVKVGLRHPEATHEADGLREWDGDGAVRLHAADAFDDTVVLLLERCTPGTTLAEVPEPEQDVVITGLLRRLWREPSGAVAFRTLQQMCDDWADEFEEAYERNPAILDPGIARVGIELFRTLPESAEVNVLLCTDLHAENVLRAEREPWLVVDPKPHVGDPSYDVLQHFLNCRGRLHDDPDGLVERVAALAGLDAGRVRLWLFARCVQESPGHWQGLGELSRRLAP